MTRFYTAIVGLFLLLCNANIVFAQQIPVNDNKKKALADLSAQQSSKYVLSHQKALALAKSKGWEIRRQTKKGGVVLLQGVNSLGFPIYLKTDNNTMAAATTGTNTVQPGGALGLNLSGSSTVLNNKLGIWDGGSVYTAHQEFAGKTITLHDASSAVIDHATHVAGTMIAKGVYAPAKGMSFGATTLQSYEFDNDVTKMSAAAAGLLLSNHSYGDAAGWSFDDTGNHWDWYGLPGDTVDYNFGFYGSRTQSWDKIAFNAPYYLIVESAGNSRGETGPTVGTDYYGFKSATDQTFVDKGARPATISNNNGYDVISTTANAKNILTVGAVNPLPYGPANSKDISITYFSSWGPTDDGRIKPDIVGDGLDVLSTGSSGTASYITLSGTSMSAPNVTGSLYLLQEYYSQKNNVFMKAATLKGLACHTAFDAGNTGPDYIYGWGLLNMNKAAQAITNNGGKSIIKENTLAQGQKQIFNVISSGDGPLMATISWTDPPGTPTAEGTINSRTPKLINDLDIRVSDGTNTFMPWILDTSNPSAAAKTGDNILDNIEQVYIPGTVSGKSYTITITHKGTLLATTQDYSLIVTGVGGQAYCTSAPLSNADSKVNKVTLANLNYTASAGCTTYSDHTDLTAQLEQGKTYPLSLTLGTCGANFNKAAKVYIDWNGNNVFDANELVATTGIINATGTYTTNITIPTTVVAGNYSLMRVVLTETSDTSAIKPCGTYAKGETQDYRVQFIQTTTDVGVIAIVSPDSTGACSSATQVSVRLKNFGSADVSNFPVTVTITAPDNSVTTLTQTYTGTLTSLALDNFTLNNTFNAIAGATYKITATTNLSGDMVTTNNQASATIAINLPPSASGLAAYYCTDSKQYQLSGSGDGELLWYQNIGDALPIAYGSPASVAVAPVNNTYYAGLNDFTGTAGPATKNVFSGGSYNQFTPYITVNTQIPVIIQSARLYIGNSGKISFTVANGNGEIVSSNTINALATRTSPAAGVQADDPNDQGAVYNLNLLLPAAGVYTINIAYDSTATIYRNNTGVTGYPFTIGNIFSIIGNGATSGTDTAYYKNFYYYLYDVKVKSAGCASATRLPVTLTKLTITQNGTVLTSSFASNNQWYLNGKAISGATGVTYSPKQSGNYQVGVTLATGCQLLSDNYVYVSTSNSGGSNTGIGLVVFPVPASSELNIVFAAKTNEDLAMSLVNAAGQVVYTNKQSITAGNFSMVLNVSHQQPGGYVLKIQLGTKSYNTKVIILR
ncbi:S8 family serine peptidase [Mucilaginibacter sp.]|uniref:S8 family serine peptidase n=1 Tax=Mucilaginibacter sp. TaxID=1882438 RepID=UPI003D12376C